MFDWILNTPLYMEDNRMNLLKLPQNDLFDLIFFTITNKHRYELLT